MWESENKAKLGTGANLKQADQPFIDYYRHWIEIYKTDGVSAHTHDTYMLIADWVEKFFHDTPIGKITRDDFQQFVNSFGKSHGISYTQKLVRQIRAAVQDAVADNVIYKDFTFRVKITGKKPQETEEKYLDLDDYHKLLPYLIENAGPDHMSYAMLLFQLQTGTRFEEAAGMTWDCVDFNNHIVTINKQWVPREQKLGPTKGNGQADGKVTIAPPYAAMLENFRQQMVNYFNDIGLDYDTINEKQLVFFSKLRKINTNSGVNSALANLCTKLGIKVVTSHAMRHTHASVLIQDGETLPYVQHRLRHKKLETTLNNYVHLVEKTNGESDRKAMSVLSEPFMKKNSKTANFS
ncbi:tyrosine-type recombinase/integrase [Secundilactobacillus kimchicus]|uniref:tyrosine-type recombinase/integrase n=1 Tax=Secundilactobacillus kimchicus TaxID=528209 RepID=UPI0020785011|nr:site-specific integrase [Secundilactobacillus kimchicus]